LPSGDYRFKDMNAFGQDEISSVAFTAARPTTSVERGGFHENPPLPDSRRRYTYRQFAFFAQDTWRLSSRLAVNYGLRYENFGVPRIAGNQTELLLTLPSGSAAERDLGATRLENRTQGALYRSDNNDWSVRLGFSYALREKGRTLLRGSYGLFYDRPFDNYWLPLGLNSMLHAESTNVSQTNYLKPLGDVAENFHNVTYSSQTAPTLTMYAPAIRDARVQSYFLGVQQQLSERV